MPKNFPGAAAGIGAGDEIEYRKPDKMTEHHDHDDLEKGRELMSDHALIAEVAEGRADIEGEKRDNHALDDFQHDVLKLLEQAAGDPALCPDGSQTDQQGEGERTHDRHDLGDVQLENDFGQLLQTFDVRGDGQVRNQAIADGGAHERGADGAEVGDHDRDAEHAGGIAAHAGNRRGNEADDDQRHTEGDELTEDVLEGDHDLHGTLTEHLTEQDADDQSDDQTEGKTAEKFFHNKQTPL